MISLEHGWVLFLLPLPLLVRYLFSQSQSHQNTALKVPFFERLENLRPGKSIIKTGGWSQLLLWSFLWAVLVVAAANPLWLGKPIALDQSGRDILLAVDVSGSMEIDDMKWQGKNVQRLEVVKAVAKEFIQARKGDRVGLILFGTNAYVQSPLTFDRKTVLDMLDDASVGLAGVRTAIGDAIGLAIKRLQNSKQEKKVLILLTDGASNAGRVSPIDAAQMAEKYGVHIYTIGLGASQPSLLNPYADLDEDTLREIAAKTKALYFHANTTDDLKKVYKKINSVEPVESEKVFFRPQTVLYPYFLIIAIILFVIGVRK